MSPNDRDYFVARAQQELAAAAGCKGTVRDRHEELAWLYQMRVIYIDRGLVSDVAEALDEAAEAPAIPLIIQAG